MDGIDFSVQQVGQLYFYNYLKKKISDFSKFLSFYYLFGYICTHQYKQYLSLKVVFFVMFNWYKTNPQGEWGFRLWC